MKKIDVTHVQTGTLKSISSFLIFLLIPLAGFSQSNLTFNDIPTIFNTDSLEKSLINLPRTSKEYINRLIILEQSRFNIYSPLFGNHAYEIDSLSTELNYSFGKACGYLFKGTRNISFSPDYAGATIQLAENALQLFDELNDEAGMFYAKSILVICYIYNVRTTEVEKNSVNNRKWSAHINSIYKKRKYRYLAEMHDYAKKQPSSKYLVKSIRGYAINYLFCKEENIVSTKNLEILKSQLLKSIDLIHSDNELKFQAAPQYNLLSYLSKDKEAINILHVAYAEPYHIESAYKAVVARQLSSRYKNIDESRYIDSIIHYFKTEINITENLSGLQKYTNYESYHILAEMLRKKNKSNEAFEYKSKAYLHLYELNSLYKEITANSYLELEKYKIQKLEIEKINSKKNKIIRNLLFSAICIVFLVFLIVILVAKNRKIQKAKIEIEHLQISRDKFYNLLVHDMQSPIKSYQRLASKISYLIQNKDYKEIEAIAYKIDETGIQLNNMFLNLMEWNSRQLANSQNNPKLVKIEDCILDLLTMYAPLIEENSVSVVRDIQYHESIYIDSNYLLTVLRNLVDNAIKKSPQHARLFLSVTKQNQRIHFVIKNRSLSLDKDYKIVHAVLNSTNEWQPGEGGVGLGLILIKDYTKKMGGHIEVKLIDEELVFELIVPLI